ncbi:TetR/AcrR family transcriptional regulator [Marinobacter nauticus]
MNTAEQTANQVEHAEPQAPRRRGRPPRKREDLTETRELLLHAGLEVLTEKGFSSVGIDQILRRVGVPKGSFYHYFKSKEAFGLELIDRYTRFFAHKLDQHFLNTELSPLDRVRGFVDDAAEGMARYDFRRGCLIGTLGQEMAVLPESFRSKLRETFEDWENRFKACLVEAQRYGELSEDADTEQLANFFWIGWEGAVLRAKLEQESTPLMVFAKCYFAGLPTK